MYKPSGYSQQSTHARDRFLECVLGCYDAVDVHDGNTTSASQSSGIGTLTALLPYCSFNFSDITILNFLYRDRSLLPWALGRSVYLVLPRGTLFQLGYGTHHWHSNSSSVCSRRHCLRDCHRTRLSDSYLLFVRFEVSVYYYYYYYYYY